MHKPKNFQKNREMTEIAGCLNSHLCNTEESIFGQRAGISDKLFYEVGILKDWPTLACQCLTVNFLCFLLSGVKVKKALHG